MEEVWKPITDYEGKYEVSNLGRVRSIGPKGVILKPCFDGRKMYLHVNLWKDGKQTTKNVHRLVAVTFLPNPDKLPEVNHIDEDKTNNAASNLEWCDHLYNNLYGTKADASKGERNSMNKFPEETILAIKREYDPADSEHGVSALARKYGISPPHVCAIVKGKRWGWLVDNLD